MNQRKMSCPEINDSTSNPQSVTAMMLTNFMPLVSFYTPGKHQKIRDILMFSVGIKREKGTEMG